MKISDHIHVPGRFELGGKMPLYPVEADCDPLPLRKNLEKRCKSFLPASNWNTIPRSHSPHYI